ncbi:8-oxoguanine DNA glycosylase OGG fold protein [Actinoplanes sp. NPDC004185]
MTYEHDQEARDEAAGHALGEDDLSQLAAQVAAKRPSLGEPGWRGQSIAFAPANWAGLIDGLTIPQAGTISRGDVFDIAARGSVVDVFTASFVWGSGKRGYGPTRCRTILELAGPELERSLTRAASAQDAIAAYAILYGGYDPKKRARYGDAAWGRLGGYGPAFFTKFLYFTTPGALILDHRLATAVHQRTKMPYLVTTKGRSRAWSPYRYAVYLHWMHQTAHRLAVEPDLLELTLFDPPKLPGRAGVLRRGPAQS